MGYLQQDEGKLREAKQAAAVANTAGGVALAVLETKVNELLTALRDAGITKP